MVRPKTLVSRDVKPIPYKTAEFDNLDITKSFTFSINYAVGIKIELDVTELASGLDKTFTPETIRYNGTFAEADGRIEVYDIGGSLIMSRENIVDLSGLNKGFYIVRCEKSVLKIYR